MINVLVKELKLLFSINGKISTKRFVVIALLLVLFRYFSESFVSNFFFSKSLDAKLFFQPVLSYKVSGKMNHFTALLCNYVLFIPFFWAGLCHTFKRVRSLGLPSWWAFCFFIPMLNYLFWLVLSFLPVKDFNQNKSATVNKIFELSSKSYFRWLVFIVPLGVLLVFISANKLGKYGTSLFVVWPLLTCLLVGYFLNFKKYIGLKSTIKVIFTGILFIHLSLFLLMIEGAICLAMSLPVTLLLGAIAGYIGCSIAKVTTKPNLMPLMLFIGIPISPLVESKFSQVEVKKVETSIVIDAAPEKVWPHVLSYPENQQNTGKDFIFKIGVAEPLSVKMKGQGVGAIRYCKFSTGAFVEPITAWTKNKYLAFDVQEQPATMKELSIYEDVTPKHLHGYFRAKKGEFILEKIGNKTKLTGTSWYELEMFPAIYWNIYSRIFIKKIHQKVFGTIKHLSEK